MNEDAIREAFCGRIGALYRDWNMNEHDQFLDFKAGYLVMLNSLEAANLRIIEQAAVIEKLRGALAGIRNPVGRSTAQLKGIAIQALAIPTDSKKILSEFMREQLGEPVGVFANVNALTPENGERWEHMVDDAHDGEDYIHLFKLPECLK